MKLSESFRTLLQHFDPVFTAPTDHTFVFIVTGWILSQRHRYVTEVVFSSGHVGDGHWSRFHRFFTARSPGTSRPSPFASPNGCDDSRPGRQFSLDG